MDETLHALLDNLSLKFDTIASASKQDDISLIAKDGKGLIDFFNRKNDKITVLEKDCDLEMSKV